MILPLFGLWYLVFPAPAGVILRDIMFWLISYSFPRTCGGDPEDLSAAFTTEKFSPHLRG